MPAQTRVAIVDEDRVSLEAWTDALSARYVVHAFHDAREAVRFLAAERVDVALIGVELLHTVKRLQPDAEVVIVPRVPGHGNIANAVDATRAAALDFVLLRIERFLERRRLAVDNAALRDVVRAYDPETTLVGHSRPMQRLHELIDRIADSPATVLIAGEPGTGKELIARALHDRSSRRDRPFVAIDCAAIGNTVIDDELFGSPNHLGLFEAARGGVLFLDEIADVPPATQVRLLRVLQAGAVDVRVIAATSVDLAEAMADWRFLADLYFCLSTFELALPPLRDRDDDVLALARRMLERHALRTGTPEKRLAAATSAVLARYAWPGNVRELGSVIEYALTRCAGDTLEPPHLPPKLGSA